MTVPHVPLPRPLHQGATGVDVVAVKRALSRAGFMQWGNFTPTFGSYMLAAVTAFQRANHIQPTGAYGDGSHTLLTQTRRHGHPGEWAFDSYAVALMRQEQALLAVTPDQRVRQAIVAAGFFWYAHRNGIAYARMRPFQMCKPPMVPAAWDCSAFVTNSHYAGGAPNPNGRPWDGLGYTGTLLSRGVRMAVPDLLPGDLVFYGYTTNPTPAFPYGSPTHVALYVGTEGGVPMVLSNGAHPMGHYPLYALGLGVNQARHYHVS